MCDVGGDDFLLAALRDLPPRRAARAMFRLRRPRPDVVDRFVAEGAAEGDVTAWPLVPLGSSAVLDRYFAFTAGRGGGVFRQRLAILHPARASAENLAWLDAASNADNLLFTHARIVVAVLSDRDPEAALANVAALRLLPFHPAWAAERLAEVTQERGDRGWTGRVLKAEEVSRIAPALTPVAEAWLNREDEGRVVALAASVGRRLPDWPELVGFLERLICLRNKFLTDNIHFLPASRVGVLGIIPARFPRCG